MSSSASSEKKNKKRVLVPIADGTEEMEAVIVADVLRRAGAEVSLASVEENGRKEVVCSRGVRIVADASLSEVDGHVVTSRGPGTAFEFSLCLVERLFGREKAEEVAGPMVMAKGAEEPLVVAAGSK